MKNHPTAPRQRRCMISGLALLCLVCLRVAAEQLPIKAYGIADGLADNSINRIVKDSHGFLWFCTGEGLARFDGSRFVNYGIEHGLAGRYVSDLLETRGGVYWVATSRGLYRFNYQPTNDGQRAPLFAELRLSAAAADQRIQTLFEDSAGIVWCGTANSLYRITQERGEWRATAVALPRPPHAPSEIEVRALVEDRRGALWISTIAGLYRLWPDGWPDGRIEHFGAAEGLAEISNRGPLLVDRDGTLWAGIARGLARLVADPQLGRTAVAQTFTAQDGLAGGPVNEIFQTADGKLWAGQDHGLSEFLPPSPTSNTPRWRAYTKANGLSDARIHALAEDRAGNLWVGGVSSGAMRIAAHGFTTYGQADGLQGPHVISLLNRQAGEFAVVGSDAATMTVFIHRFDGRHFVGAKLPLPRGLRWSWGWYQTVLQARDGEWWLAMYDGAARYAATNRIEQLARAAPLKIFTKQNGLPGNDIFRLFEDARGDLWFAVLSDAQRALARWERATNVTHTYASADGLPLAVPTAFCEDAAGNLWIGFYDGGLARYRAGRFTLFTHADGLPRGLIRGLFLDHAGRLWIATSEGGVARVNEPAADPPRFVTYDRTSGLASNRACCVTEDAQGRLYVGTGRGVDRLDLSEGVTARFTHYTSADGLAAGLVGVCLRDRDGALWFGTAQGVSRLNPQSASFAAGAAAPPPIRIGELEIAGAPRALSALGETAIAGIELEPQQNDLRVGFFSLNFAAGEALRYQTKLINLAGTQETDWSAPSAQNSVNLRLSPGAYRLLARAVGSDGVISPTPATVSFRILRPVWQRWWFLTLIGLGLASLLFTFVRARAARLKVLRESEDRFRTLAETASDAIITIDAAGLIVFTNPAVEKVFGYAADKMIGQDLTMLMPEYLRHLHHAGFARYQQTGQRHISWEALELPGLHRDGHEIPLEISFGEFTSKGRRLFTGIVRDISERKRAEEALQQAREERLRELEQVRRRIATDLHDDIGSSLTQISILSEVLRQRFRPATGMLQSDEQRQVNEPLKLIATASRELVDSMSDIVWAINPQKDQLSDLTRRMLTFASDTFTARNIAFDFRAPATADDAAQDMRLGASVRREVFLIFKESINNIAKHSRCTEADIEFTLTAEALTLVTRDNGAGFDTAALRDGHGLQSMRERAAALGGAFEIESRLGSGTTVLLRVPLQG